MQIIAECGRPGYWLKSLLLGVLIGPDMDEDSPAVVALGRNNQRHQLLKSGTLRAARKSAARFQAELLACGESEFCRRYGLPESFTKDA